jgi:hypothetical protein
MKKFWDNTLHNSFLYLDKKFFLYLAGSVHERIKYDESTMKLWKLMQMLILEHKSWWGMLSLPQTSRWSHTNHHSKNHDDKIDWP